MPITLLITHFIVSLCSCCNTSKTSSDVVTSSTTTNAIEENEIELPNDTQCANTPIIQLGGRRGLELRRNEAGRRNSKTIF